MKLNLGCGPDIRPGYVNSDLLGGEAPCDLRKFPWPWPDGCADEILMWHVLEHLPDTYATMAEIKRILKPGGRFIGQVPFCFSQLAYRHPQHVRFFHVESFATLALEFEMELVNASLGVHSVTLTHRLRNMVPFRKFLGQLLLNMWDVVDFEIRKPSKTR